MISPSNVEVDINIENAHEYIGMCHREVLDGFLRDRAASFGAKLINGIVHKLEFVCCVNSRSHFCFDFQPTLRSLGCYTA